MNMVILVIISSVMSVATVHSEFILYVHNLLLFFILFKRGLKVVGHIIHN